MEDYYEYLDSNGVTTLYKLIKDDTVALIDSYSVTVNGITTTLDTHINDSDIHTPISVIEGMIDTRISGLVNSAPETLDTLKELSDALGNDPNFATTVANQIGNKANSKHNHVVNDITDFPTIPTKLSQLENDMGFGTGGGNTDTSDCVHKTGDETIQGVKYFDNIVYLHNNVSNKNSQMDLLTTPANTLYAHYMFVDKNNQVTAYMQYGQQNTGTDFIGLFMHDKNKALHGIQITTNNYVVPITNNVYSLGASDRKWLKVYSDDVVHTSGNEIINGTKAFTANIIKKNSGLDLQTNPSANQYNGIIFTDNNNVVMAYLEHIQTTAGINIIGVYARDKSNGTHGIQITSENNVKPLGDNTYNLGLSGARWKSVYAVTYYGNLVGGITLNQSSLKMTVKDSNSDTTRTNEVILANSSNTDYGINAAFGGRSNTVVGAGESCVSQLNDLLGNSSENLYLVSDGHIYIKVGANTYANAKVITLNSSAELSGLAKVTATSFVGALTGNVTGNCSGSSGSCTGNSASATKASYLDNYSANNANKIYLDWNKQVTGYVGLKVDNTTMGGLITTNNIGSQSVSSATTATKSTTQANTDNSTNIATTAWVRTYVNSVVGSGTVGASISAYYSNATTVTATGSTTGHSALYPADYSDYVNVAPTVGTIYTGSQLFSSFTPTASGTINKVTTGSSSVVYQTTASAKATFSGAFSSSAKYLCTTANAVKFRAYVAQGTPAAMGAASVVDQSSSKSIFIRVQ